mmetsp:Transcript_135359/g.263665  ORF Transcript_135359/g.263665 Transcript_135359/m.263665 type:complete len:84 (-) Transcript_135359:564-815(-)
MFLRHALSRERFSIQRHLMGDPWVTLCAKSCAKAYRNSGAMLTNHLEMDEEDCLPDAIESGSGERSVHQHHRCRQERRMYGQL